MGFPYQLDENYMKSLILNLMISLQDMILKDMHNVQCNIYRLLYRYHVQLSDLIRLTNAHE
jgi:hypothetical protein